MEKLYKMTVEEQEELLEIARNPSPAIWGSGGMKIIPTTQDRANYVWEKLGKKYGFEPMSARPANNGNSLAFYATPIEVTAWQPKQPDSLRRIP